MAAKKKDLKKTIEEGIVAILESKDEPSEGRMKALALGIKMCALNAKLEENDYGDFFNADEPESGHSDRPAKRAHRAEPSGGGGAAGPDTVQ